MTTEPTAAIELFYSYAPEDEAFRAELEKHLAMLKRQKLIVGWHPHQVTAGTDIAEATMRHLNRAQFILLLISSDFLSSDYCYGTEIQHAMQRHERGEARVIPILLRPVLSEGAPFEKLSKLHTSGVPITKWPDRDDAFKNIAQGIRDAILDFVATHSLSGTPPSASLQPLPTSPLVWNIPYRQNPFFTGRESLLKQLDDNLTQAQAINGLGGIGKTQTAVEYAYRHRSGYRYILWASAATETTLITDFVTLATLLQLPEKDEQDQQKVVAAVTRWFTLHTDWLLILDNADDLALLDHYVPRVYKGHLLLTTRAQAAGTLANSLEVEFMDQAEGALLLLHRARLLPPDASLAQAPELARTTAAAIVTALGGLPLALDQAAAYIEETACSLSTYLERYQQHQTTLLKRRGEPSSEHPEPVATTWDLSFQQVEQHSPSAADLLRCCAFLSPDAIPEELLVEGASELGRNLQPIAKDPSLLDEAIALLRRFSLVRRNRDDNTLSIHRLVQTVLKARMSKQAQQQWARRVIRAVNQAFPEVTDVAAWPNCERFLPHAQACADLMNQHTLAFPEAARLLNETACYLDDHALSAQAEPLFERALAINEQVLGATHLDTARGLNNLGMLYSTQVKYEQAEPLLLRALAICELALGATHSRTETVRENYTLLIRKMKQAGKGQR